MRCQKPCRGTLPGKKYGKSRNWTIPPNVHYRRPWQCGTRKFPFTHRAPLSCCYYSPVGPASGLEGDVQAVYCRGKTSERYVPEVDDKANTCCRRSVVS